MSEQTPPVRSQQALNVISGKKHRGFGAGAIDLNQVSAIIIDGEEVYFDIGALHAKSKVEKGIRFSSDPNAAPNGRLCWLVWIATDKTAEGASFYAGATACAMRIDPDTKQGWKVLADHVNRMDAAMKRKVLLEELSDAEKRLLQNCLQQHHERLWENASPSLKEALS